MFTSTDQNSPSSVERCRIRSFSALSIVFHSLELFNTEHLVNDTKADHY